MLVLGESEKQSGQADRYKDITANLLIRVASVRRKRGARR
jgi:hypothetical protein